MPPICSSDFRFAALALLGVLASGCGGEKLVRVSGTAQRHGKPVPNLVINFTPEKGLRSYALTDQNGRFDMAYTTGQEGVLVGTHKVWVQLPGASKEDKERQKQLAALRHDPDIAQLLKKYGNVATTPIVVEAKADQEITLSLD
jgi:hypothetical protein